MIRFALVLSAGMMTGSTIAQDSCDYTAPRELDLDAAGVDRLDVVARAGSLDIQGEAGLERVIVRGRVCASSAELLDQVRLVERREGSRLSVTTQMPESGGGWGMNSYSTLDLELRVPNRLALKVDDSSGDARVSGVASADIDDSSGGLRISDIAGDVVIDDSSGDIDVRQVGGDVRVTSDSSGSIDIDDVAGNAIVENDSSGDIVMRRVRGDAVVEDDSSGDIRFSGIGGSARVGDDGSGDIEADNIGRDFVVDRDGSGRIRHTNVHGSVRIPED